MELEVHNKADSTSPSPSTYEVGNQFLDFYETQGYIPIPGSSLLDPSVPMSFVMSAGLVQVETSAKAYDGQKGQRYTLIQNCFRYFDLENIGSSNMHLSLFKMAGAFTFGKVDHLQMIQHIWNLLIEGYALTPERLWVTYFGGDDVSGHNFALDRETYDAWLEVGVPPERLVGLGAAENFWKQGGSVVGERDAPKCGPNTEVFFDRGVEFGCSPSCLPGCRCGRFIEFLNTLFITQHIDDQTGTVSALDEPFTESVIGLERLAMLLGRAHSVYQVSDIAPLLEKVEAMTGANQLPETTKVEFNRILVDHLRALLFLTADGAPAPGKGGRARLIRKLVREMITAQIVLDIDAPSLYPELIDGILTLEQQSSHLAQAKARLLSMVKSERGRFERTLQSGKRRLRRILKRSDENLLNGKAVVELEKHHGVPLPLLEIMLRNQQVSYDEEDYERAYADWRMEVVRSST
jgi:alanyl-tRNA synthetase